MRNKLTNAQLIGMKFNMLTILEITTFVPRDRAFCKCDCGAHVTVRRSDVVRGHTQSCGCLRKKFKVANGVRWNSKEGKFEAYFGSETIGFFFEEGRADAALIQYKKSYSKLPRSKVS